MDRNTVVGLSLIFVIFLAWMYYMQPSPEELERMRAEQALQDSLAQIDNPDDKIPQLKATKDDFSTEPSTTVENKQVEAVGSFVSVSKDTIYSTIRTDLYEIKLSNLGAGPVEVNMLAYKRWDGTDAQLIRDTLQSAYSLGFVSTENYNVESSNLLFDVDITGSSEITGDETSSVQYTLPVQDGRLVYTYTFYGDQYKIGLDIQFINSAQLVSSRQVDFAFRGGLNTTEKYRSIEAKESSADFYAGGEHEQLKLTSAGKEEKSATGKIDWIATKTKFFTQVIKANTETDAAFLSGEVIGDISTESVNTRYISQLSLFIPDDNTISFDLYFGPVQLSTLSDFDESADKLVNVGYSWMRFFSIPLVKFAIIPFFDFVGGLVSNYGIVIILFGIVIKLVLYPFTKKSFESAAAMRQLNPEMAAIREKYKDNPQKQQEAILKLYKTAGVNPVGGCLPNLLQMPILITLWMYFQNSILIRQKSFLWASDLSAPDVILSLPFSIPFLGDHISGFVLLMAASMVVQMQTSGQTQSNPSMKFLPYMMPIVLFVFFNNVASGLSLYYFVYNVVSIAQQMLINRDSIDHDKLMKTIEPKKQKGKASKKKSGKN